MVEKSFVSANHEGKVTTDMPAREDETKATDTKQTTETKATKR